MEVVGDDFSCRSGKIFRLVLLIEGNLTVVFETVILSITDFKKEFIYNIHIINLTLNHLKFIKK